MCKQLLACRYSGIVLHLLSDPYILIFPTAEILLSLGDHFSRSDNSHFTFFMWGSLSSLGSVVEVFMPLISETTWSSPGPFALLGSLSLTQTEVSDSTIPESLPPLHTPVGLWSDSDLTVTSLFMFSWDTSLVLNLFSRLIVTDNFFPLTFSGMSHPSSLTGKSSGSMQTVSGNFPKSSSVWGAHKDLKLTTGCVTPGISTPRPLQSFSITVSTYVLILRSHFLSCLVGCRFTMTSLPPFRFVSRGMLPLGLICSVVPRHTLKSAFL